MGAVGQWKPRVEKTGRNISKGDPSGPSWTWRRKGQGTPKVALKFDVYKVGAWEDDWQNLGEGAGEDIFQICGVQVPEAMFVYFNKMNNHVFTIIKSTQKFMGKHTNLVSKAI